MLPPPRPLRAGRASFPASGSSLSNAHVGGRGTVTYDCYRLDHGVFRELRDVHYFNQVGILFGAVTWPHEQDVAPEPLLAKMVPLDSNLAPDINCTVAAPTDAVVTANTTDAAQ